VHASSGRDAWKGDNLVAVVFNLVLLEEEEEEEEEPLEPETASESPPFGPA